MCILLSGLIGRWALIFFQSFALNENKQNRAAQMKQRRYKNNLELMINDQMEVTFLVNCAQLCS